MHKSILLCCLACISFLSCEKQLPKILEGDTFSLTSSSVTLILHTNAPIGMMSVYDYAYDESEQPIMQRPCTSRSTNFCQGEWYSATKGEDGHSINIEVQKNTTGKERRFTLEIACGKASCSADFIQQEYG